MQIMFYLNLSIELFLNVVILYYRIKTKVNSDDVRKTKMMEDEQVPMIDEIDVKGLDYDNRKTVNPNMASLLNTQDSIQNNQHVS